MKLSLKTWGRCILTESADAAQIGDEFIKPVCGFEGQGRQVLTWEHVARLEPGITTDCCNQERDVDLADRLKMRDATNEMRDRHVIAASI